MNRGCHKFSRAEDNLLKIEIRLKLAAREREEAQVTHSEIRQKNAQKIGTEDKNLGHMIISLLIFLYTF